MLVNEREKTFLYIDDDERRAVFFESHGCLHSLQGGVEFG